MPLTRIDSAFLDLDAIGGIDFDVQSGVPTLSVDATTHRVGIGTDNPSYKLQVEDSGVALGRFLRTGAGAGLFQIMSQDGGNIVLGLGDVSDPDIQYIKSDNSDNSLSLGTNAGEKLRITSNGYLKLSGRNVQGTANGDKLLRIYQPSRTDSEEDVILLQSYNTSTENDLKIGGGDSTFNAVTSITFRTAAINTTSGSDRLCITSGGNIGINIDNPTSYGNSQATLVIEDTTNPAICISDTGQTRDWWLIGLSDGLGVRYADGGGSGGASNVTSSMFFKNNGNIGIGINDPQSKLQIENAGEQLRLTYPSIASYIHEVKSNGDYAIDKDGTERLRIASDGRLTLTRSTTTAYDAAATTNDSNGVILNNGAAGHATLQFQSLSGGTAQTGQATISAFNESASSKDTALTFGTRQNSDATVRERLRIDSSGRVQIGMTGGASTRLHVANGNTQQADAHKDCARFIASTSVPANTGGLTIGAIWHNTDVTRRIAYLQSEQGLDAGGTGRALSLNPNGGNVGIGITHPTTIFEVVTSVDGEATLATFKNTSGGGTNETVDIKLGLENNVASNVILRAGKEADHSSDAATDNFFAIHTTSSNTSSEKLRITSAGNVGIGTDNPGGKLDVEGTLLVGTTGSANGNTTLNGHVIVDRTGVSGGNPWLTVRSSGSSVFYVNGGGTVYAGGLNSTGGLTVGTSGVGNGNSNIYGYLSVDRNGIAVSNTWFQVKNGTTPILYANGSNVGIGTDNPTRLLSIEGDINLASGSKIESYSSGGNLQIQGGSTYPGGHIKLYGGSGDDMITFSTSGASTSSTERLRISNTGELSISGSRSGLNVSNAILKFNIVNSNGDGKKAEIKAIKTADITSELIFSTTVSHTFDERMRIGSSGNVGIGTNSPEVKFTVWDTSGESVPARIRSQHATLSYLGFGVPSSTTNYNVKCGAYDTTSFAIATSNTERLVVNSTGNVGIGTNNPIKKIDVYNGSTDSDILRLYNDEVGIAMGTWGTGSAYPREATINGTRFDQGSAPQFRIGGQAGIKFCVDLNTERFTINASGVKQVKNGNLNIYQTYIDFSGDQSTTPTTAVALYRPADGRFAISTQNTERFRVSNTGKVRVGTGDASYNFEVQGSGNQSMLVGSTNAAGAALIIDGDSNGDGSGTDYASLTHDTSGHFQINNRKNGSIIFKAGANETEWARIKHDGNVGIGTNNPQAKLDVRGGIYTTETLYGGRDEGSINDLTRYGLLNTGSANFYNIYTSNNGDQAGLGFIQGQFINSPVIYMYGTNNTHHNAFIVGNLSSTGANPGSSAFSTKFLVRGTDGHVGIGTTNPTGKLHAGDYSGTPNSSPGILYVRPNNLSSGNQTSDNADIRVVSHSSNYKMHLEDHNGSSLFTVRGNGNVGIGTNNPSTHLNIKGSTDGVVNLDTTDSRGTFIRFQQNGTSHTRVGCADGFGGGSFDKEDLGLQSQTGQIVFLNNGSTERMRIYENGQVNVVNPGGTTTTFSANGITQMSQERTFEFAISESSNYPTCNIGASQYAIGSFSGNSAYYYMVIEAWCHHRGYTNGGYFEYKKWIVIVGDKISSNLVEGAGNDNHLGLWDGSSSSNNGFNNFNTSGATMYLMVNPSCGARRTGRCRVRFYTSMPFTPDGSRTSNNTTVRSNQQSPFRGNAGSKPYIGNYSTTSSSANVHVSSGQLYEVTSSLRYKTNVEDLESSYADNVIDNLRPVWYRSKQENTDDPANHSYFGLIAEEVAEIEPRLVNYTQFEEDYEDVPAGTYTDENGEEQTTVERQLKADAELRPQSVQYDRLSVMLLDVIQRQKAELAALTARVAALEAGN